jgi:glycosyltransferase involved in cell wall biosynthesis
VPAVLVLGGETGDEAASSVPDQIAFGTPYLALRGYSTLKAPLVRWPRLRAVVRRARPASVRLYLSLVLGQIETLGTLYRADLVYAPRGPQALLVATLLKRLGLLDTAIVSLVHQRPDKTLDPLLGTGPVSARLFAAVMRGCDALPALSPAIADEVAKLARRPEASPALAFGPDAGWYRRPVYPGAGVVAVGMAGRDFVTFGRGAARAAVTATIVCPTAIGKRLPFFGANVRAVYPPDAEWLPYRKVVDLCATARVHAVPLVADSRLYGLNSLADALALGKPVIVTRIPEIGLDVEDQGIGRWVAPGDVEGWQAAISWFEDHPEEAVAMGARARALVDDGLNSEAFAHALIDRLRDARRF